MDDILAVQIDKTIQTARHNLADLLLSQSVSVSDVAAQRSAVAVLHHDLLVKQKRKADPQGGFPLNGVVVANDELRVARLQDL